MVDVLPAVAAEVEVLPFVAAGVVAEVAVPDQAGPVEFEALDVEFGGDVLQEQGGTDVRDRVQEPWHDVGLRANVDRERFEAEGLGRDQHAVALRAAGVLAEPFFGFGQVSRQDDGIALGNLGVGLSRGTDFQVEELMHEEG